MLLSPPTRALEASPPEGVRAGTAAGAACATALCLHCRGPLASDQRDYCCAGCRTVHQLITGAGLSRYYDLRGSQAEPAFDLQSVRRDRSWLDPIATRLARASGLTELSFELQGVRCAACIWLISELFAKHRDAARVVVNPGRGRLELCVGPAFPLARFVAEIERFGYLVGELGKRDDEAEARAHDDLLLRTAICMALGGNAMMFAAAIYLGLSEGPLHRLLHTLNFGCATLAVLIGGPVFARSAAAALRRGILHLDLPIAVGIALTYGAALWSFSTGNTRAAYYDSLATFIGLMLLGRWLKERIVLRNQRQLLSSAGAENVWVRRVVHGRVELVRAPELGAGDELLVPAGDLVPVPSVLADEAAQVSLDWINGESEPSRFERGSVVPAGAFNAGLSVLHLRAQLGFSDSPLADLLARTREQNAPTPARYQGFSGAYVVAVLASAVGGFAYWALVRADVVAGLEVATAVCVVTCPCAIGIATPLAYDLVLSGLRRAGLFVRAQSFLDRALSIRRVVFDKTGTLTTGRLSLVSAAPLGALDRPQLDALYTLVAGSVHPKSLAVARALRGSDARLVADASVSEVPGAGVTVTIGERVYRLGQGSFAAGEAQAIAESQDLVFSEDGRVLCVLATREALRSDAARELAELSRDGYETFILSGDEPERVSALARELGVPPERAFGGRQPEGKARWIAERDRGDMLMVGDGINDSLAVARAFASGTPSIDRAFMPWRTDFYFVTPGLSPLRLALRAAKRLQRVVHGNQVFAVSYNVITVLVALAGGMRPWLAAVLMPLSSIVVLSATSWALSGRSSLWKS